MASAAAALAAAFAAAFVAKCAITLVISPAPMVTKLPASPAHMAILIKSSFSSRVAQTAKPSAPTLSTIPVMPATKPNDRPPLNGVNATATIRATTIPATDNHFCHHDLLGSSIGSIYPEHIGWPLTFTVPQDQVWFNDSADFGYSIEYADGAGERGESQRQHLQIKKPTVARLPAPQIHNHSGGPINPGLFPNGLTLRIQPSYVDIQQGDRVLVHGNASRADRSLRSALRVDRSILDRGLIESHIPQQWLGDDREILAEWRTQGHFCAHQHHRVIVGKDNASPARHAVDRCLRCVAPP